MKNIFDSGELLPEAVVRKFRTTAADGKTYDMSYEKAQAEYVKYQARTLSDAEKQYLASLKKTEASLKRRIAGNGK